MNSTRLVISSLLLVGFLSAQEASHPNTQVVILDNEFVRVLDIRVPPGVFESRHSHARGVTIAMSNYDNETKSILQGRFSGGHTRFGEVKWAEPVTHEARNTGTTEQHVIRIELKKGALPAAASSTSDPLDALVVCKDTQKLLFENAYVRAIEDRGAAGNVTAKHTHKRGLLVNLSDYDTETKTWPDGKISRTHATAGEVRWSEPVLHEVKNIGTTATYAIRVELK